MVKYREIWDKGEPDAVAETPEEAAKAKQPTPAEPQPIRMTAINAAEALKRGGGRYTLHEPKPSKKATAKDDDDDDDKPVVRKPPMHRPGGGQVTKTIEAKDQPPLKK